jgi:hypothetical protein
MRLPTVVAPLAVVAAVLGVTGYAVQSPVANRPLVSNPSGDLEGAVGRLNETLAKGWSSQGLSSAGKADDLTVLRRLTLALAGSVPSLEEIRRFEADTRPDRLAHWAAELLEDVRFADYFAERLTRAYVGVEGGQFILFRRDRFKDWLSEQLKRNRPYDQIVHDMIATDGVWTDKPAVNFISAAYVNDAFDENKLAARTSRAFLGQRIDCAQCHDHPFAHWKQSEFEGLAACFGKTRMSIVGVDDGRKKPFEIEDRKTLEKHVIEPAVPFGNEWLPEHGAPRQRLADWVTHADNRRFDRAVANRAWGLLFGKPYLADRPVDDLPDPDDPTMAAQTAVLDLLADDFRQHGRDLRRLVQVIAGSVAFRAESREPEAADSASGGCHWEVFPLVRLRPEQVVGSMLQASSIRTINQNSHLFTRTLRFFREKDFVEDFGDPGENELGERAGTVPQALLRMNGQLQKDLTDPNPLNATARIASSAGDPAACVEVAYLVCLTRRPTKEEAEFFTKQISETPPRRRDQAVADLIWTLFNSTEFSWNH